jgi:hypothetical protein
MNCMLKHSKITGKYLMLHTMVDCKGHHQELNIQPRVHAEVETVGAIALTKMFSFTQAHPSFSQIPPWICTLRILSKEENITKPT